MALLSRSISLQGPAGALLVTGAEASMQLDSVEIMGVGTFGDPWAAAVQIQGTAQVCQLT